MTEGAGAEKGESGRDLARGDEVGQEAAVRTTDAADQVEKTTGIVDQAVVEVLAVIPVMTREEEAEKIKRIQVHSSQKKRRDRK